LLLNLRAFFFLRLLFSKSRIFNKHDFIFECFVISLLNVESCSPDWLAVHFIVFAVLARTVFRVTVNSHWEAFAVLLHALRFRAFTSNTFVWQLFTKHYRIHLRLQSFFFGQCFLTFASHFYRVLFKYSLFSLLLFFSFVDRTVVAEGWFTWQSFWHFCGDTTVLKQNHQSFLFP